MADNEVRVTSATGAEKGEKPCEMAWLDPLSLMELGNVAGMGAKKYAPHNYRKGYPLSSTLNALQRHLMLFEAGEDLDPESGLPHMAHVMWHAMNAMSLMRDHPEFDDRWNTTLQTSNAEAHESAKKAWIEGVAKRRDVPDFTDEDEVAKRRETLPDAAVRDEIAKVQQVAERLINPFTPEWRNDNTYDDGHTTTVRVENSDRAAEVREAAFRGNGTT